MRSGGARQMAFLDGNQPERVCAPVRQFIEARGGSVSVNTPLKEIVTNADGTVKHLLMRDGSLVRLLSLSLSFPLSLLFFLLLGARAGVGGHHTR